MARRRTRRAGEGTYHPSRRSLPRPLILDLLDAVYSSNRFKRPQSTYQTGYGGGYLPHAKRLPARSYAHPWAQSSAYLPRTPSKLLYPTPRRLIRGNTPPLKAAFTALKLVGTSIPTMPGDRKTEPVKRPNRVSQCTQRQDRKEVLHALNIAGRRGSAPGKRGRYHRTLMSNFSCKG